jgi:hypothetical protein
VGGIVAPALGGGEAVIIEVGGTVVGAMVVVAILAGATVDVGARRAGRGSQLGHDRLIRRLVSGAGESEDDE